MAKALTMTSNPDVTAIKDETTRYRRTAAARRSKRESRAFIVVLP